MSDQNEPKMRTITMTDRPPVRIREDAWPEIAHGRYFAHDNEYEFQANRKWLCDIRVREHEDGRRIVYGVYRYDTAWQRERDVHERAGVLLDSSADVVEAIRDVGQTLIDAGCDEAQVGESVRDCIADLPAEEI